MKVLVLAWGLTYVMTPVHVGQAYYQIFELQLTDEDPELTGVLSCQRNTVRVLLLFVHYSVPGGFIHSVAAPWWLAAWETPRDTVLSPANDNSNNKNCIPSVWFLTLQWRLTGLSRCQPGSACWPLAWQVTCLGKQDHPLNQLCEFKRVKSKSPSLQNSHSSVSGATWL